LYTLYQIDTKKTNMGNKMQLNGNNVKNVRLHVPLDIYKRLKKYQAQKILDDKPEQSLAQICVELLDKATQNL
jgi:hypothetical protein